ncbi:glyceraldehyde-3-phosphate dehydrogenase, type I [Thalassoporum mexicanum PCC 7367]|uniref:type I glyceraldehyde-3-phosphate dehydrogenase n=1 Tax=Thalassoporum mexicanum TaxID=3457544 RepID=UPI00029FA3BA|nr:type I glyceraldehyde-3-phosphate dehydrogenase [Pseudanabaena sp. PCC 7367]AFY69707.1 glyceraldehyde-3-phosphate dehydrogenase, type I [Pseudanabaena sp. PCC 7367]
MTKIAINGFGRIGRAVMRILLNQQASDLEIVAINDLVPTDNLAYLLAYDTPYGPLGEEVTVEGDSIKVKGAKVKVTAERDPANLPWQEMGVDIVIEATGFFTARDGSSKHLTAGAKKVIVSAPAKQPDLTVVMGVNEDQYDPAQHQIISNASCTTNCLAPVAKVLLDTFGIETGFLTTCHAYTATQGLVDKPDHKDFRRGRAAAQSIVPSSTGAATAVAVVIPELKGKMDGLALRVPTITGSIVDFVVRTEKPVTKEAVNAAFAQAAAGRMQGFLGIAAPNLVSSDIVGNPLSSIVETNATMTLGDRTVKVLSWYDNEYGYASRICDLTKYVADKLG